MKQKDYMISMNQPSSTKSFRRYFEAGPSGARARPGLHACHKWRLNHKPNSLRNSLKAIELFLNFYTRLGKSRLEEIVRDDLEAFVESEQDRETEFTSARTRLMYLLGFLRFLIEGNVVPEALLEEKDQAKVA